MGHYSSNHYACNHYSLDHYLNNSEVSGPNIVYKVIPILHELSIIDYDYTLSIEDFELSLKIFDC